MNLPRRAWWGGWWERLIGILKALLRKMLGKASLPYEDLNTILCDAEAIINTRPLTYLSEDPEDLRPLSPSMFLQENREYGVPDCDMLYRTKLEGKFKHRQKILEDLRKRFRVEYLGQLSLKNGKKGERRKIKIGDIVLIGDDTNRRISWPLARVMNAIPGRDGQERVFVLKTEKGLFKRAVQRVYPLEIVQDEFENSAKNLREKASVIGKSSAKTNNYKATKRPDCEPSDGESNDCKPSDGESNDCEPSECEPKTVTTRSGRVSRKPDYFNTNI
ncbi:PREDICTED: uncharacterized protein LOC105571256 [Vollenhovia emeryi]|uniref:uncharacterized protein LOC105571256 n=1 Tax=Vollenhovia emeryi TaxID=411798 RepID=UPI0005F53D06|nr:PREDICTED: uncharacterized protein LOC105571256 [Vollenhovia emeryi]